PERPRTPQQLFHRVAPYYDSLNSLFSLGFDRSWRRRTATAAGLPDGARVLDVATGTGALARALLRRNRTIHVVGCDINTSMLAVARKRLRPEIAAGRCHLVLAGAERLPFPDHHFDAVCVAFAIDDLPDRQRAVREMRRVLRPGGALLLLELSVPDGPVARRLYLAGLGLFALLGRSRRAGAYAHLRDEIVGYRGVESIRALFASAGLTGHRHLPLTGGIARLHLARAEDPSATPIAPDATGGNRCR
ncbi:ubiquinone/menaquinone biosynthesis methyltransferase, partial [Streptomyces sp. URMC 123]|uniref:ubiquinone/menaquinone biosynthesis methyltransferase n=1 Tax=Streptomyces sp. URMC 123 TaxID=3423403 RepID=UPI003F1D55A0